MWVEDEAKESAHITFLFEFRPSFIRPLFASVRVHRTVLIFIEEYFASLMDMIIQLHCIIHNR